MSWDGVSFRVPLCIGRVKIQDLALEATGSVSLIAHYSPQMRQKGRNWAKSTNLPPKVTSVTQMSTTLLINRWIVVALPAAAVPKAYILTIKSNTFHENDFIKGCVSVWSCAQQMCLSHRSAMKLYSVPVLSTQSKSVKHAQRWTYLVVQHFSFPAVLYKSSP